MLHVRQQIGGVADLFGARPWLSGARDGMVKWLAGSSAEGVVQRRDQIDDCNLKLLLSFSLGYRSNCLDVGAHKGKFLLHIGRVAPAGHHLAYEPLPDLHDSLVRKFPEMEVRQAALASEDGESEFVHVRDLRAYSGLRQRQYPREVSTEIITVRTERLDDHVPDGWLPDFVKIDVEGGEVGVIEGAIGTIRRAQPVLAFEHGCRGSEPYGATDEDLYRLVCDDAGLRIFDMDGNGPLELAPYLESLESGERWNWVAHP